MSINTSTSSTVRGVRGCGHCRNLNLPNWNVHNVNECPELAKTKCTYCKNYGHTRRYCAASQNKAATKIINTPEMQASIQRAVDNITLISGGKVSARGIESVVSNISARVNAPLGNAWALAAKRAVTTDDKALTDSIEAKIKADFAEKKRLEHEAYLERKARREQIAKEKKAQDDANYKLYKQHMWYEHGPMWYLNFERGSSRENEIPGPFYDRVQQEIEEHYRVHYEMEEKSDKKEREKEASNAAEKAEKKATLSPEEYRKWKEEKWWKFHEEVDDWLDRGFCAMSEADWIATQREQNGKIWLEQKMQDGEIVLGPNGKYKYFGKVLK